MVSAVISRVVILLFGTLYPAYASYKAVKTKNVKEYVKWMMYWIVFAFFTCLETFADIFIAWLPFYYELKILFVLWLLSPATKGASILYRKFVHPQLAKREKEIDTYISKASDQGYSALLNLGSKGFNYATNVVLTTAIKGQSKIADHLRKSYSLGDLSQEPDAKKFHDDSDMEFIDDETDNRIIEEQYQREMQEKESTDETTKRRRRGYAQEPDLHSVDESEEEVRLRGEKEGKPKKYTHKEAKTSKTTTTATTTTTSVTRTTSLPSRSPDSIYSAAYSRFSSYKSSPPSSSGTSWRSRSSYSQWK